ncbi:hypothetical protein Pelsub_P1068 [Pelolinea submarina]|nr:hypothetical protein Pelsub_P1068 [Pelolinea submarina]
MVGVKVRVAVAVEGTVGERAGDVKVAERVFVSAFMAVSVGVAVPFPADDLHNNAMPNR